MSTNKIERGVIVVAPRQPELGPGKVMLVRDGKAHVYFRDDSNRKKDTRLFPIDGEFLEIAVSQSDEVLDNLPEFKDGAFVGVKNDRCTFEQGLTKFREEFPGGFNDPDYLGTKESVSKARGERNYKVRAHERYQDAFGDGRGRQLLAEGGLNELVRHATDIATKDLNLLNKFEAIPFADALKVGGPPVAEYLSALFEFIESEPDAKTFNALAGALANLPTTGKAGVTNWPTLTVLPFVARPDRFMFLKPTATCECADRLRFDLGYTSKLQWGTYDRLLTMSRNLLEKLKPLGARDFIDVQSYMWVVANY